MSLLSRVETVERHVFGPNGNGRPEPEEPEFAFFAVNCLIRANGWAREYYWPYPPPEGQIGCNHAAGDLDALQASGVEVALLFDPGDCDCPYRFVRHPERDEGWYELRFADYSEAHPIMWRDYTPGACLAAVLQTRGWHTDMLSANGGER